ncbi:hypothetical protein HPB48_008645 [Haemaphysalis longicornis]|uniref:Uncharacterized protein n=1 Tax=Haemaphysalis longicornis TaxID=44386 RepID=A0A9J6H4Y6_HAELO|nr:hypothetical protein HPB48_008645 [Haemaphysalis longicornis]
MNGRKPQRQRADVPAGSGPPPLGLLARRGSSAASARRRNPEPGRVSLRGGRREPSAAKSARARARAQMIAAHCWSPEQRCYLARGPPSGRCSPPPPSPAIGAAAAAAAAGGGGANRGDAEKKEGDPRKRNRRGKKRETRRRRRQKTLRAAATGRRERRRTRSVIARGHRQRSSRSAPPYRQFPARWTLGLALGANQPTD